MSVISVIVEKKKERLSYSKGKVSLNELKGRIREIEKPLDFKKAVLRKDGPVKLICELKKSSPSKGLIRDGFDLHRISAVYEDKAVDAISVLTEEDYFSGDLAYIPALKKTVTRPILRKDFIFDEYQIYESRASGADALLLIASLLDRNQAEEYIHLSGEMGLAVLFEVHDARELEKALRAGAETIGINNRDLATLEVDIRTTLKLKREIPAGKVVVSESGIRTKDDISKLLENGIDAALIGTTLMEAPDIGKKIDELRGL